MKFQHKTMGLIENDENKKYRLLDIKSNLTEWIGNEMINLFGDYVAFVDNEHQAKKVVFELENEMTLCDIVITVELVEKANISVDVKVEQLSEGGNSNE